MKSPSREGFGFESFRGARQRLTVVEGYPIFGGVFSELFFGLPGALKKVDIFSPPPKLGCILGIYDMRGGGSNSPPRLRKDCSNQIERKLKADRRRVAP